MLPEVESHTVISFNLISEKNMQSLDSSTRGTDGEGFVSLSAVNKVEALLMFLSI